MTLFLMPVLYYIFNRSREKRLEKKALRLQAKEDKRRQKEGING